MITSQNTIREDMKRFFSFYLQWGTYPVPFPFLRTITFPSTSIIFFSFTDVFSQVFHLLNMNFCSIVFLNLEINSFLIWWIRFALLFSFSVIFSNSQSETFWFVEAEYTRSFDWNISFRILKYWDWPIYLSILIFKNWVYKENSD